MPNAVSVVFNADTAQFVAHVDQATGAVSKQAQTVADAKNRILAALTAQTQAAKDTGASSIELEKIHTKAAQGLANVTEKNADKVIAALNRISEKNRRVAEELKNLPTVGGDEGGGGHNATEQQKISALARGGGLRASENFLRQFDVVNKIAGIAFPVLGAAALGKEIWSGVEGLHNMYETAEKLPAALDAGFGSINLSLRSSNDALDLMSAKLENAHDKFERKPENAIKVALAEARVEADRFATSLGNDAKAVNDLLSQNKLSGLYALMGKGSTSNVDGSITSYVNQLQALGNKASEALDKGDTAGADSFRKQVEAKRQSALAWAKAKLFVLDNPQFAGPDDQVLTGANNDANRNTLLGFQSVMLNQQHRDSSEKTNLADQNQAAEDEKKRATQEAAKQAATAQQEAARKAMEAQRKQWESQDDSRKDAGTDSPLIEANTWAQRVLSLKVGSEQYIYAQHELAAKLATLRTADAEAAKQADEKYQKDQRASWDLSHDNWATATHRSATDEEDFWVARVLEADKGSENYRMAWDKMTRAILDQQKQAEEASKARSKAMLEAGQQKSAYAEASLAIQVQTGQISRQDAAYQQANIHAEQYRQQMMALTEELKRQQALDASGPSSAGTLNAQAAIDKADADRKVQVMKDAAETAAASWQGALKNANAAWVQDAQDSAKQVSELYGQFMNGLNQNLADLAVGDKSNFAGMFKGLGKTIVGDGLKHIEAPVLSALGLGKADGSAANPFSVRVVGGADAGGFADGLAGGLSGLFGRSDGSGGGTGAMGTFAGLASSALSFIPGVGPFLSGLFGGHRALGGGVKAGVTYDVGEMGREEFTPTTDGTITPNNKLNSGAAYYTINMDGGVTPEQVHQQINSALAAVHPKVVRDSANAVSERMARRPRSAG